MPQPAAGEEARSEPAERPAVLAAAARTLTVGRLILVAPFLWVLVSVSRQPTLGERTVLVALYVAAAASDFLDGRLARAAGAADRKWGVVDVVADATFNVSTLACAATLGLIGPWLPAVAFALAARYLLRILRHATGESEHAAPRDRMGNLAGVLYYGVVALVVARLTVGRPGPRALVWLADGVFVYSLLAFSLGVFRSPNRSA